MLKDLSMYWNLSQPKILVTGLNPHAGESGDHPVDFNHKPGAAAAGPHHGHAGLRRAQHLVRRQPAERAEGPFQHGRIGQRQHPHPGGPLRLDSALRCLWMVHYFL